MKSSLNKNCMKSTALKSLALAVALALPHGPSLAFAMQVNDVVSTRADRNTDQHYGRDSVYATAHTKLAQSSADSGRTLNESESYQGAALVNATSSVILSSNSSGVPWANQPQPYGRAGGYIGWERIAVMRLNPTLAASSKSPDGHVPNNAAEYGDNVAALGKDAQLYRRESTGESEEEANRRSRGSTNGGKRKSDVVRIAMPGPNQQLTPASD